MESSRDSDEEDELLLDLSYSSSEFEYDEDECESDVSNKSQVDSLTSVLRRTEIQPYDFEPDADDTVEPNTVEDAGMEQVDRLHNAQLW